MAKDLNVWNGIGRATRTAELKYTNAGLAIAKFGIAVNGWKDGDVSFFNCTMFGKLAENISKYITKGKQLGITAELKQNTWTDQTTQQNRSTVEFIVNNVQLLASPKGQVNNEPEDAMFKPVDENAENFSDDVAF